MSENYVWDGDQLLAVMDTVAAIQHEYFDGTSLDQVFADQTVLSGVLWPLDDRTGAARDVISSAGVNLDHRKLDSFGKITSQTGAAVDYDQFFSGLAWDADSQLYYARARWYDPVAGEFIGEDPLRFGAGDTNLTRYSANDPVNLTDPSGLSWLSHAAKQLSNVFEDVGDFVETQWDNGNIQKGLLVAGTIASGGALAFGGLAGMGLVAGSLGFASGAVNSYEVFSGNQIGDGTFSRFLGAAAAVTGGFYGNLPTGSTGSITSAKYWTLGRTASAAAGLTSGYEIASGKYIGDGTLSSLLHVTNLGVNHGSTLFNTQASTATRFGVGLNLAVGGASVTSTGDRGLQQALRSLSIAAGVWNTGTEAVMAAQTIKTTVEALRPTPIVAASGGRVTQTGYISDGQMFTNEDAGWQPMESRRRSDPHLETLFNGEPSGFIEQFMQTDPAAAEGSLNLRQKVYLWKAQGELPTERNRLSDLQSAWWWSRDDAAIAASVRRIARLESTIENFNGNDIQYHDIHSADNSVVWSGTKGFGNGLKTGAKANVNGLSSAAAGFATLGYVDGVEVWTVQQDDINGGYGTALIFARAGGELLLVASPTGLANIAAKGGKISQAARYSGYTMRAVDTATNAHDASESAYRMMSQNDFSLGNTTQFATSTMGFAGDYSELNKVLDNAGYKVSFSGFASGVPMHIGPKGAQDKLSNSRAKQLELLMKKDGTHIHDFKGSGGGKRDFFVDKETGDIYLKPKDGSGPGERSGYNVSEFE